jgi:hypothetical protein
MDSARAVAGTLALIILFGCGGGRWPQRPEIPRVRGLLFTAPDTERLFIEKYFDETKGVPLLTKMILNTYLRHNSGTASSIRFRIPHTQIVFLYPQEMIVEFSETSSCGMFRDQVWRRSDLDGIRSDEESMEHQCSETYLRMHKPGLDHPRIIASFTLVAESDTKDSVHYAGTVHIVFDFVKGEWQEASSALSDITAVPR